MSLSTRVYNDCVRGMQQYISDNTIDLIFTDPPYGIKGDHLDQHYKRDESYVVPGYCDVPLDQYAQFSAEWITECARVLRPGGSMYIVSGYTNLHHILNALHATALREVNHIIAKYSFGVATTRKYVSSHYHILFWEKPARGPQQRTFNTHCRFTNTKQSYHDRLSVQDMQREYKPKQIKNKNQLSENFVEKFILYSSQPGDTVLDCFAGSLSTGRAAVKHGRNFVGFELNRAAYDAFLPILHSGVPESK